MPCVMALRVVSLPATASSRTKKPNSSEARLPSSSAATSVLTMSFAGHCLRSAAMFIAYEMSSVAESAPISSVIAYSGSSYATILLDQSKILTRSSCGTPISSAIACSGSSQATWVTKSKAPSGPACASAFATMEPARRAARPPASGWRAG